MGLHFALNAPPSGRQTVPNLPLTARPVGWWDCSTWQQLSWSRGEGQVVWTATWGTPLFDLRSDADSATSTSNAALAINRAAGAQLFVAIRGLLSDHSGLNVYAQQIAAPFAAKDAAQVRPDQDVTAELSTGLDRALLTFFPPGSGYQIRFWQLKLRFDYVEAGSPIPATLPPIAVQAATY